MRGCIGSSISFDSLLISHCLQCFCETEKEHEIISNLNSKRKAAWKAFRFKLGGGGYFSEMTERE